MAKPLHRIERSLLLALAGAAAGAAAAGAAAGRGGARRGSELAASAGLSGDQARRGIEWLRHKGLASVEEGRDAEVSLGPNGREAAAAGLPERRLAELARSGVTGARELSRAMGPAFGPALGAAKRRGWIPPGGGPADAAGADVSACAPLEGLLRRLAAGPARESELGADAAALAEALSRPGYASRRPSAERLVSITAAGRAALEGPAAPEGAIDVEAAAPPAHPARLHPLTETVREVREALVSMGFSEVDGGAVQTCFWNFDALFVPQDHPAREMQDTFYLDAPPARRPAPPALARAVAAEHRRGWGRPWDARGASRLVLRTHTTCVTARYLAGGGRGRAFSVGRVFRNEKPSYKHLAEFTQVEGVVAEEGATLRRLMGIQSALYRRLGLGETRFWPTYFPYTEPSLQTMVRGPGGRWAEVFGMGVLRPEVARPLGARGRVLAWGGGVERVAMLRYGVSDVREMYSGDVGWLRGARPCR